MNIEIPIRLDWKQKIGNFNLLDEDLHRHIRFIVRRYLNEEICSHISQQHLYEILPS